MKTKGIGVLSLIIGIISFSYAADYNCVRRNNGKDFNLNSSSFIMTNWNDKFTCNDRVNYKKIYASAGNDIVSWVNLSVGTTYYLGDGNDIFSTFPINYENWSKYDLQNDIIDGGSWNDILNIDNLYSSQVYISGDCSTVCTLHSDYSWFDNIKLISIEKIKLKDKVLTFPLKPFSYTIVPKWTKLMRYDLSNRRPLKFVDTDKDSKADTVAETDVWNIKNANWYIDIYYDKDNNVFYFDTDLSNITPETSAWTYWDPNIYKWNNPWTWTGVLNEFPKKISDISWLNISFYYKVENEDTPMNFYNEGYITQNKFEKNWPQNGDFEFMILWYHFIDNAPGNKIWSEIVPIKINGVTKQIKFDIYSDNTLWKQTFITFVPTNYNNPEWELSYSLIDFIKIIKKYHPYVDEMYLEDWHLWNEFWGNVKKAKFRTQIGKYLINLETKENKDSQNKSTLYLNFYWNTSLNLCLPFWTNFQFTWWYWYGNFKWKWVAWFNFLWMLNSCNTCYIPIFKVNGWVGLFSWDGNFGIYYDCNYDKNTIIEDMCSVISRDIIKSYKYGIWFQFIANWNNLVRFESKSYITIFYNWSDLYSFYEQYCKVPKLDISVTDIKQLIQKLRKKVIFNTNRKVKKLPAYVKLDEKHSTIIFNYAKNYELRR